MPRIEDEFRCDVRVPERWTRGEFERVWCELHAHPAFGFHADGTPRWTPAEEKLLGDAVFWSMDNCPDLWPEPESADASRS